MIEDTKPETFRDLLESLRGQLVRVTLIGGTSVDGMLVPHLDYVSFEEGGHGAFPVAHIVQISRIAPRSHADPKSFPAATET
jgi:hypothetical protein